MTDCIENAEMVLINDKRYLAVYLKPKFIPLIVVDGNSILHNPILIEEPNKGQDYNAISKLSISLNKLCNFASLKTTDDLKFYPPKVLDLMMEKMLKEKSEQTAKTNTQENQEEKHDKILQKDSFSVVVELLKIFHNSNQYETENENYFTICDNFREFIGKKIGYEVQIQNYNTFIQQPMLSFEHYDKYFPKIEPCDFQLLVEELIAKYISFFLGFFRSNKLRQHLEINL